MAGRDIVPFRCEECGGKGDILLLEDDERPLGLSHGYSKLLALNTQQVVIMNQG